MTTFQLLKANESLLKVLHENRINVGDVMHLQVYTDYERMKAEGHKVSYIAVHLADKYGISDRGVYKIIQRFNREVAII